MAKNVLKNKLYKFFFQHFVIRTHATLLLQLSKPFFWQLQILASGAAQKSLKLQIA